MSFKLYDRVRLVRDRPDLGLHRGDEGVVIEIHTIPVPGFEVEFRDDEGQGKGVWIAGFAAEELEHSK